MVYQDDVAIKLFCLESLEDMAMKLFCLRSDTKCLSEAASESHEPDSNIILNTRNMKDCGKF